MSEAVMSATTAMIELVWGELRADIASIRQDMSRFRSQAERAETAGGVPAYTYANLPRVAQGGVSDGTEYIDLAWCSNGRKAAEGAGVGTGQLVYYDASIDDYRRVRDDTVVTV
jgi:hypothetical protein